MLETMKPGEWGAKDGKPSIVWHRPGVAATGEPSLVEEIRTYASEEERFDAHHRGHGHSSQDCNRLDPMRLRTTSAANTAPVTNRPLADRGLLSYRYRQPHGFVMIGAKDDEDALKQAGRSIESTPQLTALERWNGTSYSPVVADKSDHDQMDKSPDAFNYQLLARLKQDCEYYLGHGNRSAKHLWATNEAEQIEKMKDLYAGFSEKPEWISLEVITQYEAQMCPQKPCATAAA